MSAQYAAHVSITDVKLVNQTLCSSDFSPMWPPRTALLHSNLRQRDLEFAQLDLDFVQRDLDFVQLDLELQPT